MKNLLLSLLLLTAGRAYAQLQDPTNYPIRTGNPYRKQVAVADSNSHVFKGANTIALFTGKPVHEALDIALTALRNGGYTIAFSNSDSLTFGTRPKYMPKWARITQGFGVWGRVLNTGEILFYPYYFNLPQERLFWQGSGQIADSPGSLPWDIFREAELAARTYQGGRIVFLKTK